jgi:hypothetical protein
VEECEQVMAKESIYSIGKEPIFRETFNDQQAVERNGGVIDTPQFSEGKFIGSTTLNNNIYYYNPIRFETLSIRIKVDILDITKNISQFRAFLDLRDSIHTSGAFLFINQASNLLRFDQGTGYVNGNVVTSLSYALTNGKYEFVLTNITTGVINQYINRSYLFAINSVECAFELFEIYEGELTAEEVSNLYNNSRYRELNAVPVLNLTAEGGIIEDKAGNSFTNTDVDVVRDGQVYVQSYNGSSSAISLTIQNTTQQTTSFWIKLKDRKDESVLGGTLHGAAMFIHFDVVNDDISYYSYDGGNLVGSFQNKNLMLDKWTHYCFVRSGIDVSLFIDGVFNQTVSTLGTTELMETIWVGRRASNFYFNGYLNDIKIYNEVLSNKSVSELYNSTKFKYKG